MEPLLTAIVIWLSANFGLPAPNAHPRIAFAPPIEMATLRYRNLLPPHRRELASLATQDLAPGKVREVVAVYNDDTHTIYLPEGWSGATPAELSVLVHEMVHHLQNLGGLTYECPMGREKVAYEAQDKWLGLFGRSLESEFDVNPLALLVASSCAFGMIDPP